MIPVLYCNILKNIYIYILLFYFIWWSPFIPSMNLDELLIYRALMSIIIYIYIYC